jgi:hypothetical protein
MKTAIGNTKGPTNDDIKKFFRSDCFAAALSVLSISRDQPIAAKIATAGKTGQRYVTNFDCASESKIVQPRSQHHSKQVAFGPDRETCVMAWPEAAILAERRLTPAPTMFYVQLSLLLVTTTLVAASVIAFFLPDNGRCAFQAVVWDRSKVTSGWNQAGQIRINLKPNQTIDIDGDQNESLNFHCENARTLTAVASGQQVASGAAE